MDIVSIDAKAVHMTRYILTLMTCICCSALALASVPFRFENEASVADMQELTRRDFPVGTKRYIVRAAFVDEGRATLKVHPSQVRVEKYIYDINLCSYYIWRWNVSADYDTKNRLTQFYINGEPALPDGTAPRVIPTPPSDQKAAIIKIRRPRPEAFKGESSLCAIVLDRDTNLNTIDDQELLGGGPTRADPINIGKMHVYHVEPWRSIFDMDDAKMIVPYSGDCAAADAAAALAKKK